ncbi:MAG TPA: hypothetical protein VJG90_02855 [Candidatus Nanoarchaeia archaeon]|nr:hypothetical protein [Candidatus Nanoarchaeia archaeon]
MAALPWFIYMIVGVIVSAYSRIVMGKSNLYVMKLFFYLGIVFFGIGVYKLLLERMRGKSLAKNGKSRPADSSIVTCKVCGTRNYRTSFFCHICGAKVEKKALNRS